jgi:hypothetical protein
LRIARMCPRAPHPAAEGGAAKAGIGGARDAYCERPLCFQPDVLTVIRDSMHAVDTREGSILTDDSAVDRLMLPSQSAEERGVTRSS